MVGTPAGSPVVCPNGVLTARGTEGSNFLSSTVEALANLTLTAFSRVPARAFAGGLRLDYVPRKVDDDCLRELRCLTSDANSPTA
jgi:hypothetical protein